MTDPKLEQQARELLATACGERVEDMLYDRPGSVAKDQAIRAIVAALSQQRAVPEGYVLIGKPMLRGMIGDEAMAQIEAACVYPLASAPQENHRE